MNSNAFTLGALMSKEAVKSLARVRNARRSMNAANAHAAKVNAGEVAAEPVGGAKALGAAVAPDAAPAAAGQTRGFFPRIREALFGPKPQPGLLSGAGKLGLLAAGGLGLWNTARTGSPFKHDMGVGAGGMFGSGARSIAQNDPLAQFGGMEPASANYWDQVTMAALQRKALSEGALDRIRMLRSLGTGA